MALNYCPRCKGKMSNIAKFCPHCGFSESAVKGSLQIGNEIILGKYEQNDKCVKEPIKWTVIDIKNNTALLISNYCIDCKVYDDSSYETNWSDSYIRKWLNNEFYESAFSLDEQIIILQTNLNNSKVIYDFDGEEFLVGESTTDKIFLLSFEEIQSYLSSFKSEATQFAKQNGVYCKNWNYCSWWLRTLGSSANANIIWPDGTFSYLRGVNDSDIAIRPAFWVDISSLPINSFVFNEIECDINYLKNFEIEKGVLKKYIGKSDNVIVPYIVTEIASGAFESCVNLNTVVIPNSVTKIGERVFRYCTNLQSITIPNSVTEIGMGSFVQCTSLKEVILSQSLSEIPMLLFSGCNNLMSIVIPESVTKISTAAFCNCSKLEQVILPKNLLEIGEAAFIDCKSLETVKMFDGIKEIEEEVFEGCDSLKSIVIPRSVTKIKRRAFSRCRNLIQVIIPDSVTYIDLYAFYDCFNLRICSVFGSYAEDYAKKNNIIAICKENIDFVYNKESNYNFSQAIETYTTSD